MAGLPEYYVQWFKSHFGDPAAYYTDLHGGPAQAINDYKQLAAYWQNYSGRYITPAEMQAILATLTGYLGTIGAPLSGAYTMQNAFDYLTGRFRKQTEPPQVTGYSMGEI